PWNIDQYQARDIWDRNRDNVIDAGAPDGSGMRFCIIDTGFLAAHDDFQGITASGVSQISGESWTEDGNGHGTHVAGTANAVMNDI
ncbi:S8 family serine peptidase, partial [Klebsiella pneumoniae]|uniref:S8 family serine peptidase n=1 Tax=Klebsiella pneumoniae TaxID=573 RepID=UPI0027319DDE